MWLVGSVDSGVPPLSSLKACDVKHLGNRARKKLNYMKKLFDAIKRAGKISGVWKTDPNYKWDLKYATDLFQGVFKYFCLRSSKSGTFNRRFEALSWMTIYNQYVRNGKRLAGEQEVNTTQQTLC